MGGSSQWGGRRWVDCAAAETQALGKNQAEVRSQWCAAGTAPAGLRAVFSPGTESAAGRCASHLEVIRMVHPAPSCCSIFCLMQLTSVSSADQPPILPELATSAQKSAGRESSWVTRQGLQAAGPRSQRAGRGRRRRQLATWAAAAGTTIQTRSCRRFQLRTGQPAGTQPHPRSARRSGRPHDRR